MTSPGEKAFQQTLATASHNEIDLAANEAKIVAGVLKAIKTPTKLRNTIYSVAKKAGRRVTLSDVEDFVEFPCYVTVAEPVALSRQLPMSKLFSAKHVFKTKFVKQFYEDKLDFGEENPHAMFMWWPRHGVVVVHDILVSDVDVDTARMGYVLQSEKSTKENPIYKTLYIEELRSFLTLLEKYDGIEFHTDIA